MHSMKWAFSLETLQAPKALLTQLSLPQWASRLIFPLSMRSRYLTMDCPNLYLESGAYAMAERNAGGGTTLALTVRIPPRGN